MVLGISTERVALVLGPFRSLCSLVVNSFRLKDFQMGAAEHDHRSSTRLEVVLHIVVVVQCLSARHTISAGLFLRFDPRPHGFCSIIQSATDVLSDLIYKLFSQRCYIRNIGMGPSRGQFSQTVSLPFVKAQVFIIKHNPSVVCVMPQHGSSHDPFKEMEFA